MCPIKYVLEFVEYTSQLYVYKLNEIEVNISINIQSVSEFMARALRSDTTQLDKRQHKQ